MNFEDLSDTDLFEIATPIMDNLMEASTRIDYEAHVRDCSDRMKKVVTKEYFQNGSTQICVGEFCSFPRQEGRENLEPHIFLIPVAIGAPLNHANLVI